jgi:polysaccharide deacetylase 2 family uncharacterized protein YibQ
MRSWRVLISIAVFLAAAGFMVWRASLVTRDWSAALEKSVSGVFLKSGLVDDNLVRKSIEERKAGNAKYIHTYLEYDVPRTFSWQNFEPALKSALKKTKFSVTAVDQVFKKDLIAYSFTVSRGKLNVFTVKVNRLKKAAVIPRKKEEAPAMVKKGEGPKVAIVMDDFGYNMNNLDEFFGIGQPITLSILPNQRYSRDVATSARARGYEVILHLPLEAHRKDVVEEADTIRSGMSEKDIIARIKKELESVPGADGVSNHMGSKATEDKKLMVTIIKYLKERKLYFFDSMTSERSVCAEAAAGSKVRCARRDIFLDNSSDIPYIEKQLQELKDLAFARGNAIAVCHDRKNTIIVLSRLMPLMAKEGIIFVYLSEMVD